MSAPAWHIITGEYPPRLGGVAGYTQAIARALAAAGDEVHVWTPMPRGEPLVEPGVTLHRVGTGYGPSALAGLARALGRCRAPKRILVQYVPQAFGMRGMNLPFCAWVRSLQGSQVWVMFHEVAVPWGGPFRFKRNVMAAAHHAMAAILLSRADRVFLSVPFWESYLRPLALRWPPTSWLPIPSNVPTTAPPDAISRVRAKLGISPETKIVGHFGTYNAHVAPLVQETMAQLLRADRARIGLLLGRDSEAVAKHLRNDQSIAPRVFATGALDAPDVAAHLLACDVLAQPLSDGVSGRRTTIMAGLALGVPMATNKGAATESLWNDAVELASSADGVGAATELLLRDPAYAARLARRGQDLYESRFSLAHTVRALRAAEHEHVV
jgi:glycosyltransferase involved in cell wall biosynthesis